MKEEKIMHKRKMIKMNNDTNRLYIFDDKTQYIFFSDVCGTTYCSLSVDTIKSNYDLKPSAAEMIRNIIKKYLKQGNFKKGSAYGISPTYVYTPRFIKPVYLQIKQEILLIIKNPDNYNYLDEVD